MIETRENQVVRLQPRPNDQVNGFFMCDYGRLNYRWMNERHRAETPLIRAKSGLGAADWEVAVAAAAKLLSGKKVSVIASPMLSNESLYLLRQLIDSSGGTGVFRVEEGAEAPLPGVKDLALRKERAANVTGAELLGFKKTAKPLDGIGAGDALLIVGEDLDGLDISSIGNAGTVVVIGPSLPDALEAKASVVLPTSNFAEEEGTVTNLRGRVQRFLQAKAAPGLARPTWLVLGDLLGALGKQNQFFLPADVFAQLASSRKEFAGLSYDTLGFKGLPLANQKAGAA
jgi:NADH-quinone oxidoreductase subunit G